MGQDLYEASPAARRVFNEAEAVRPGVRVLCFEGPKENLNITANTQPCLYTVDMACVAALEESLGYFAFTHMMSGAAGFSLGEVAAACQVGYMTLTQGFQFVCRRAEAMHRAGEENPGVMFAILKLNVAQIEDLAHCCGGVYPVNYNSPVQTVVACSPDRADDLTKAVNEAGGKALKLPVSGAFHSPLMDVASAELTSIVAEMSFGEGLMPLYSNMTGMPYGDPQELLARQVNHPVQWTQTVENMVADGFDTFIEIGPGQTLSKLIGQINGDVRTLSVRDCASLNQTVEYLGGMESVDA
jgi:[acyl-carrier-protein] S-malonyltransferase